MKQEFLTSRSTSNSMLTQSYWRTLSTHTQPVTHNHLQQHHAGQNRPWWECQANKSSPISSSVTLTAWIIYDTWLVFILELVYWMKQFKVCPYWLCLYQTGARLLSFSNGSLSKLWFYTLSYLQNNHQNEKCHIFFFFFCVNIFVYLFVISLFFLMASKCTYSSPSFFYFFMHAFSVLFRYSHLTQNWMFGMIQHNENKSNHSFVVYLKLLADQKKINNH